GEGWFATLDDVPRLAITMTVPAIMSARQIVCLVHGSRKAAAVARCFNGPPTPDAPASSLATHAPATVYIDEEAAAGLDRRRPTAGSGGARGTIPAGDAGPPAHRGRDRRPGRLPARAHPSCSAPRPGCAVRSVAA